jgi:hypothetical protein
VFQSEHWSRHSLRKWPEGTIRQTTRKSWCVLKLCDETNYVLWKHTAW